MTHLDFLSLALSNERMRLAKATKPHEIELRTVWVAQLQREVDSVLVAMNKAPMQACDLSDDELLAELNSPT
jgi:hypothetical protein